MTDLLFGTLVAQPILYLVIVVTLIGIVTEILKGLEGIFEMFVFIDSSSAGSEHIEPIFSPIMQPLLIIGLVIFALILSWQAFKTMFSYMGFQEITEPWKLIVRGITFVVLVFYSQEILAVVINNVFTPFIEPIETFGGETLNIFKSLNRYIGTSFRTFAFIRMAVSIYLGLKLLGVTINLAQRLLLTSFMVAFAPLAFACGVAKSTLRYFTGYIKVFASVLAAQIVQVALLTTIMPFANEKYFSISSSLSSRQGLPDMFLGFFLIMAVFKIIRKVDEILRELGFAAPLANAKLDLMSQVVSMSFVVQSATSFVTDFTSLGKVKKPSIPGSSQSKNVNPGGENPGGRDDGRDADSGDADNGGADSGDTGGGSTGD